MNNKKNEPQKNYQTVANNEPEEIISKHENKPHHINMKATGPSVDDDNEDSI